MGAPLPTPVIATLANATVAIRAKAEIQRVCAVSACESHWIRSLAGMTVKKHHAVRERTRQAQP